MTTGDQNPATLSADARLLAEYQRTGAQDAFGQLVQRHQGMVARTCYRLLGNAQDAEDATQTVFLIFARNAARVDRFLAPWLHKVAQNVSVQLIRSRARRQRREQVAARSEAAPLAERPAHLAEEIDLALGKLPADLREAVILRYLEGRSQEEAAALLGCPRGTLSKRASRGLDKLRDILSQRGALAPAALLAWLQQESAAAAASGGSGQLAAAVLKGSVSSQSAALADGFARVLFWTKLRTAVLVGAALAATVALLPYTLPASDAWQLSDSIQGDGSAVRSVAFSPDGRLLAWAPSGGGIRLRELSTGAVRSSAAREQIDCLAFAPDGKTLASTGSERAVKLWELTDKTDEPLRLRQTLRGLAKGQEPIPFGMEAGLAFSPDGLLLAATDSSVGRVFVWDTKTGGQRFELAGERLFLPRHLVFSPDGARLVAGGRRWNVNRTTGSVQTWNTTTGARIDSVDADSPRVVDFAVAFAPDGGTLAFASEHDVHLRDTGSGKTRLLKGHTGVINALAFNRAGSVLASGSAELILWDVDTGSPIHTQSFPGTVIRSVAFSRAGVLAVSYTEGTIRLFQRVDAPPDR